MTTFYDLSEEQRIALTERAVAERRTVHERWTALGGGESEPWNARAALAAEFLQGCASVVDLGCGMMSLERYLQKGTAYIPVDVVARDHRTVVCDLNIDKIPQLEAQAVACLGLVEYILEPHDFLSSLSKIYGQAVISYCITDAPTPLEPRRSHAWVNDFSRAQIEAAFGDTGWLIERAQPVDNIQIIWRVRTKQ